MSDKKVYIDIEGFNKFQNRFEAVDGDKDGSFDTPEKDYAIVKESGPSKGDIRGYYNAEVADWRNQYRIYKTCLQGGQAEEKCEEVAKGKKRQGSSTSIIFGLLSSLLKSRE